MRARIGGDSDGSEQKVIHLDVQAGTGGVHAQVSVLNGKGCIDVLSQNSRVHNIPGEGGSGIANVDMDGCCL